MTWQATWRTIAERMTKIAKIVGEEYGTEDGDRRVYEYVDDLNKAALVSSKLLNGKHCVAIDIDVPAALVPSSTPGHHHLYVDVQMDWHEYERLLCALADAGVIEPGYADVSIGRKATHLRTPWTRKGVKDCEVYLG